MSESNGKAATIPQPANDAKERRSQLDTTKVWRTIERSLNDIAWEAAMQAGQFLLAADIVSDGTAVRYGRLVDATECMEIAMTYLGQLKSAVAFRLAIEDEQNIGF
ncbi:hypothetical protein [Pseudonocardia sp. GCM10023141]|uniref:hypothetical protein n=1 Tax=Pseudonocardia sp. GCM10023141 TaxID=3252653 RepID=UPI00360723BB